MTNIKRFSTEVQRATEDETTSNPSKKHLLPVVPVCFYRTVLSRAVDPHSLYADPDPAVFLNADPDPDPYPGPGPA